MSEFISVRLVPIFGQSLGPILDEIAKGGAEHNRQIVELLREQEAA